MKMLRKRIRVVIYALILTAGVCANAVAQRVSCTARLSTSTGGLSIDAVTIGSNKYQTNLSITNLGPLSLLQSSAVSTTTDCFDPATLSGSVLTIPDVGVGTDFYSARLRVVNAATNQYNLDIIRKNPLLLPDPGYRVTKASNPFATVDGSGTTNLGYQDADLGGTRFRSASDGLTFANPTALTYNNRSVDSRKTLMPDGVTWWLYEYDLVNKVMTSYSSSNGNTFTLDSGTRYAPASGDNNTLGVYDAYVASDNSVILIYIGDMMGANNLRMARSTENGMTFTYLKGNVLGDEGGATFVDNKTILLPDGRRRLISMRNAELQSFISSDGLNYTREDGVRLSPPRTLPRLASRFIC
jgi:hypothetical protein